MDASEYYKIQTVTLYNKAMEAIKLSPLSDEGTTFQISFLNDDCTWVIIHELIAKLNENRYQADIIERNDFYVQLKIRAKLTEDMITEKAYQLITNIVRYINLHRSTCEVIKYYVYYIQYRSQIIDKATEIMKNNLEFLLDTTYIFNGRSLNISNYESIDKINELYGKIISRAKESKTEYLKTGIYYQVLISRYSKDVIEIVKRRMEDIGYTIQVEDSNVYTNCVPIKISKSFTEEEKDKKVQELYDKVMNYINHDDNINIIFEKGDYLVYYIPSDIYTRSNVDDVVSLLKAQKFDVGVSDRCNHSISLFIGKEKELVSENNVDKLFNKICEFLDSHPYANNGIKFILEEKDGFTINDINAAAALLRRKGYWVGFNFESDHFSEMSISGKTINKEDNKMISAEELRLKSQKELKDKEVQSVLNKIQEHLLGLDKFYYSTTVYTGLHHDEVNYEVIIQLKKLKYNATVTTSFSMGVGSENEWNISWGKER